MHRAQALAFGTCRGSLASPTTACRIIDSELPAWCAQWRVAVAQGGDSVVTRRDYAWRIAAKSGAKENRLQAAERLEGVSPG